ncbi:MAG: InlB B-repeat-containing protein [Firmicutes bacterium]|nr:InlB B-repeat-containing protein [Bacillota bacterium]
MKKARKSLFLAFAALLCALCFSACVAKPGQQTETSKNSYTVAFNSGGGSTVASVTRIEGSQVAKPADPVKEGFTFSGWFFDFELENPVAFPLTLNKDYVLYAKWSDASGDPIDPGGDPGDPVKFSVTFDLSGGTGAAAPLLIDAGGKIAKPADPAKTGYTFGGWYADANFETAWAFETDTVSKNVTLHAKWTANQYAVTFNVNGGEGVPASVQAVFGAPMPAVSVKPTRELHSFTGFFDAAEGGVKYYNANLTSAKAFDKTAALALFAQWEAWEEDGDGSQANPYKIYAAQHLTNFAVAVNNGDNHYGKYVALRADIDLDGAEWTPIAATDGTAIRSFTGNFNGNGFTVGNFKITSARLHAGLFGNNAGTIENVTVADFEIDAANIAGTTFAGLTSITSTRCFAGGIAGYNGGYGIIRNCATFGSVKSTANGGAGAYAGGIVGINTGSARILECYTSASVTADGVTSVYAGGFVGRAEVDMTAFIRNCYATGDVSAVGGGGAASVNAGGFVGYFTGGTIVAPEGSFGGISNCYASGNVTCESITASAAYAGGFVGNNGGLITNCVAFGNAGAQTAAAGLTAALAGGFSGSAGNFGSSIGTCFRYEGQQFFRKSASAESTEPSNTNPTANSRNALTLNITTFYTDLLGWDAAVWDLTALDVAAGKLPTLK